MVRKTLVFVLAIAVVLGMSTTVCALSWQTEPIMGHSAANTTGDLVVITGDTPTDSGGNYYYDVDHNLVLGPTIPHYSMSGDDLYMVGNPSVEEFFFNPDTWSGSHWYDTDTEIHSGSGIYLTAGNTYTYTRTYSFLGTPGNAAYDATFSPRTYTGGSFVMLQSKIYDLWLEDAGPWMYTETWTDNSTCDFITASKEFAVTAAPVPEPCTILLLSSGLGLMGIIRHRRSQPNN